MNDQELHNEENIQLLKKISSSLKDAIIIHTTPPESIVAKMPDTVITKLDGKVDLEDRPFNELSKSFSEMVANLSEAVVKAINDKPDAKKIEVSNISDAIAKTVSIDNLKELGEYFATLENTIKANQPIVKVDKQVIEWPKSASQPISVRLSDGKSFYNAIMSAVSAATGETDPLVGYQICEVDETGETKYYGYAKPTGAWYILQVSSSGSYRYASGTKTTSFATNWTNRASLTYNYIYEVF